MDTQKQMSTCDFCGNCLADKYKLKKHQETALYCLKIQKNQGSLVHSKEFACDKCTKKFTQKYDLTRHKESCKGCSIVSQLKTHEKTILEQQIELTKLATIIEGQKVLIEELRRLLSEKEKDQQTLALTAISRPTTNIKNTIKHSVIQNLTPLLEHEMKQHVPQLTVEHVRAGAEGYAKFALSHPLRDKITCTDASRKKLAWKNDSGDIVYDMEGTQLSEKFFRIIKDRNFALFRELVIDLGKKWDDAISRQDQDEADAIAELTDKIGSWRKQAYDASNGDDNELRNEFVRYLCIMSCSDTINK